MVMRREVCVDASLLARYIIDSNALAHSLPILPEARALDDGLLLPPQPSGPSLKRKYDLVMTFAVEIPFYYCLQLRCYCYTYRLHNKWRLEMTLI